MTDRRTDGQTDRQNYDSQDRASIAASCGKKPPKLAAVLHSSVSCLGNKLWPWTVALSSQRISVLGKKSSSWRSLQLFLQLLHKKSSFWRISTVRELWILSITVTLNLMYWMAVVLTEKFAKGLLLHKNILYFWKGKLFGTFISGSRKDSDHWHEPPDRRPLCIAQPPQPIAAALHFAVLTLNRSVVSKTVA